MNYQYLTTEAFDRQTRKLSRKYRNIHLDITAFQKDFDAGRVRGMPIPGLEGKVYKIRVKSTDMKRGKRGGFRIIYYLQEEELVVLLTIYAKVEREDIPVKEIQEILDELEL